MRIRRIKVVIVVFRPTVRKKEGGLPVLIAAFERRLKFIFSCRDVGYALQGEEHVSGVEVVDPRLLWFGAVQPRAVRLLVVDDVTSRAFGEIYQFLLACLFAGTRKHFCCK